LAGQASSIRRSLSYTLSILVAVLVVSRWDLFKALGERLTET
jgi:hypothetical protein